MTKSEILLARLIEERLTPGVDVAEIDQRIRGLFEEEWCVVFADMAGFSRHSAANGIIPFLCLVHELRRLARPVIESHTGHLLKMVGDGFLVVFRRPPDALACLLELNRTLAQHNAAQPSERQIELCAGLGFGRMLKIGDEDVWGVEVNRAARLGEDLAKSYEILCTDDARAALLHTPGIDFEPFSGPQDFPAWRVQYALGR